MTLSINLKTKKGKMELTVYYDNENHVVIAVPQGPVTTENVKQLFNQERMGRKRIYDFRFKMLPAQKMKI